MRVQKKAESDTITTFPLIDASELPGAAYHSGDVPGIQTLRQSAEGGNIYWLLQHVVRQGANIIGNHMRVGSDNHDLSSLPFVGFAHDAQHVRAIHTGHSQVKDHQ